MNDITKARYFLKTRRSDLQHLTSFGLMFSTAEANYRKVKLRQRSRQDTAGSLDAQEVETAVDYAALKYLKKFNQLPRDAAKVFAPGVTLDDKRKCAETWINECRG